MNRSRRGRAWPWLLLVLVLAGTAIAFLMRPEAPLKVRTQHPTTGTVEESVVASSVGTVEPLQTASVSAEVAGRVTAIRIRQGPADAGAPIILLDQEDLEGQREQLRRDRDGAKLRVEQAELRVGKVDAELKRMKGPEESLGRIEQLEKDLAIAHKDVEIARSAVASLDAALALLELRLRKTTITAPFDGTVTKVHVEVGESVNPGRALFTFQSRPPFLVRAPIDEVDLGRLKPGLEVRIRLDAFREKAYEGRLHEIMPAANVDQKNNRTCDVKVKAAALPAEVVAGMSANVEVILGRRDNVLRLPTGVLREDHATKSRYVWVIESGRLRRRAVTTGLWNWELTEITGGLKAEDVVVSQAADAEQSTRLKEGVRVEAADVH